MIVQRYQNKHFERFFIDPVTLGKTFHDGLTILEFVFNQNALEINCMGEGVHFKRLNSAIERRGLIDLLNQNLINNGEDTEEEFKIIKICSWDGKVLYFD